DRLVVAERVGRHLRDALVERLGREEPDAPALAAREPDAALPVRVLAHERMDALRQAEATLGVELVGGLAVEGHGGWGVGVPCIPDPAAPASCAGRVSRPPAAARRTSLRPSDRVGAGARRRASVRPLGWLPLYSTFCHFKPPSS